MQTSLLAMLTSFSFTRRIKNNLNINVFCHACLLCCCIAKNFICVDHVNQHDFKAKCVAAEMYILWVWAGGTLDHFWKNEDGYCTRVIQAALRQHITAQKTSQTPVSKKSFQPTTGHHGNTEEKQEQRKKAVTHFGGERDYFYSTNMLQHFPPKPTYTI